MTEADMKKLFENFRNFLDEDVSDEQFEAFKEFVDNMEYSGWTAVSAIKQYAKENFDLDDFIGQGAEKIVYQFDDKTVLKAGHPRSIENEIKISNSNFSHLAPSIIKHDKYWALTEKVELIEEYDKYLSFFPELAKISQKYFDDYKSYYVYERVLAYFKIFGRGFNIDLELEDLLVDSAIEEVREAPERYAQRLEQDIKKGADPLFHSVLKAARALDLPTDDFRKDNVGVGQDGQFLIIDF